MRPLFGDRLARGERGRRPGRVQPVQRPGWLADEREQITSHAGGMRLGHAQDGRGADRGVDRAASLAQDIEGVQSGQRLAGGDHRPRGDRGRPRRR